jgi:hypothetical protein
MTRKTLTTQASRLVTAAMIASFAAGCQKPAPAADVAQAPPPVATLPLSDAPASAPAPAPPVSALPAYRIPRSRVARPSDAYAFAERAADARYGFGDAPPDYAFDYDGASPWAWQGDNGYYTVAEPLPGGGERYYYYDPGSDTPYYVYDGEYGYGYQGGALVVVYDRYGRPLPDSEVGSRWDYAGRYMWRAQALWRAMHGGRHYAVARDNWQAQRPVFTQQWTQWDQERQQDPNWAAYHQQYGGQYQQPWGQERYRREAEAYRYDQAANNPTQAQHEREAAFAAVGIAGGAVAGAAIFGGRHGQPPQTAQAGQGPRPGGLMGPPAMQPQVGPQGGLQDKALARQQAAIQAQQQAKAAEAQSQAAKQAQLQAQAARAQGARQAQLQAQAEAARQAQLHAQAQQQALAARQAQLQAQRTQAARSAQQAQAARQSAQIQAARQAQFQSEEARAARIQAQQAEAGRQAQQLAAARQAQLHAQAANQAAQAARQTQAQAAHRAAQVQAERQAQSAKAAQVHQVQPARPKPAPPAEERRGPEGQQHPAP